MSGEKGLWMKNARSEGIPFARRSKCLFWGHSNVLVCVSVDYHFLVSAQAFIYSKIWRWTRRMDMSHHGGALRKKRRKGIKRVRNRKVSYCPYCKK